jgi:hypothetical protein
MSQLHHHICKSHEMKFHGVVQGRLIGFVVAAADASTHLATHILHIQHEMVREAFL